MTAETVTLLGGYQATIYRSALGDIWLGYSRYGPHVKVIGSGECIHYLTPDEARASAAALLKVADAVEAEPKQDWPEKPQP
jgi:hypothetical protein